MNIVSRRTIDKYIKKNSSCKEQLLSWYHEVLKCEWNSLQDIKDRYSSASFLGGNIVIFNIKGNGFRLVVKVAYKNRNVFVKWIGTHAEYDKKSF